MLRHYFTLRKTVEELQFLRGFMLTECFTQEKDTVVFCFEKNGESCYIEISTDNRKAGLLHREEFRRARKNTMNVFPEIICKELQELTIAENERLISMKFGDTTVHALLFGGGSGNLLLTDTANLTVNAFKTPKNLVGNTWCFPENSLRVLSQFSAETPIVRALSSSSTLLGKHYAEELCTRLGFNPSVKISSFSAEILSNIEESAENLRQELLATRRFYLLRSASGIPLLSLLPLAHYNIEREFSFIGDAILARIAAGGKEDSFQEEKLALLEKLRKKRERLERALSAMEEDGVAGRREAERRLFAELLLAQADVNRRGMKSLMVNNWDGESLEIPLDEKLTIRENAETYFSRARNARLAQTIRKERLARYERDFEQIRSAEAEAKNATTSGELRRVLSQFFSLFKGMEKEQAKEQSKYREFQIEGYTLYVGKNAADNDELTVRFAKPNDYWFHARGVSGSHAVLRWSGSDKPPKHILLQCASIAAYYSKSRNAKMTPVAYTQKKYVRKPKGANQGAVTLEREEVVMVQPKLPPGEVE